MWEYPRRIPLTNSVLDPFDFVEGYVPFVDRLGRLGAHNFDEGLSTELNTDTELASDVHRRAVYITPTVRNDDDRTTPAAGAIEIGQLGVWYQLDGLNTRFASRGGLLDIHASMQIMRQLDGTYTYWSAAYLQLGISINGTVVAESVVGDLDYADSGIGMEVGLNGIVFGAVVSAKVPVPPGFHSVAVVAKVLPQIQLYINPSGSELPYNMNRADESEAQPFGTYYVGNRDLLVVEDR